MEVERAFKTVSVLTSRSMPKISQVIKVKNLGLEMKEWVLSLKGKSLMGLIQMPGSSKFSGNGLKGKGHMHEYRAPHK